jgi:uncharacterized RDD family membrane protein YckC
MQIYIGRNGEKQGPYPEAQVREMLAAGALSPTDLAWHEGLSGWMPLQSVLGGASAPAGPVSPIIPGVGVSDPNLAERGTRLGAVLLDSLIALVCAAPGGIVLAIADGDDTGTVIGSILLGIGFLALAVVQIYLLSTRGQTLGKRMVSVRIVKFQDNSNPGFVGAVLLRSFVPALLGGIPIVGPLFSIVDICFIFSEDRRCLHDLIAGTKVVKA